jgi:hypothetical protein
MSMQAFDNACEGCKPAMLDVKTGQVLPDDAPSMKIVLQLWNALPLAEKQAWHRVTCQNSRALLDVQRAEAFARRIQDAFSEDDKDA